MVWHIKRSILWFRKRVWGSLGPGLIAGAADDDPSGIATYSVAGAQFGTSLLWTALITWPLMAAVQMMCARIGMVTGRGLTAASKKKFPRPIVSVVITALLIANTINVAADLSEWPMQRKCLPTSALMSGSSSSRLRFPGRQSVFGIRCNDHRPRLQI